MLKGTTYMFNDMHTQLHDNIYIFKLHSFIHFPPAYSGNRLRRSVQTSLSLATNCASSWGMPTYSRGNYET